MNILETNLHVFSLFSNAQVKIQLLVKRYGYSYNGIYFNFLFTHFSFHRDEIWEIKGVIVPSMSASDFNFVHIILYSMASEMCKVQERYSWSERKVYEFLSPVEPQCWYRLD